MAYIQPNSIVKLLRNCPLDSGLRDTWWFSSKAAQTAYFEGLAMVTFTAQSYTRVTRNVIRVEYEADKLYSCNYMMFMNTAYNAVKWFYAFVDYVEYVNDHASNIYFTIDPIQTWYFEYKEKPCFIQRMHTVSDRLYANLEPEPIAVSEYVFNGTYQMDSLEPVICVQTINSADESPRIYENTYCGGRIILCETSPAATVGALNDLIANYLMNNPEAVTDMHMCLLPNGKVDTVCGEVRNGIGYPSNGEGGGFSNTIGLREELRVSAGSTAISGYVPYNKKLYSYPFHFLEVFTPEGDSMALRYEFFPTNIVPQLVMKGNVMQPSTVRLYPQYYKQSNSANVPTCFTEQISLSGFPSCSWSASAYAAWSAQNSVPLAARTAQLLGSAALSYAMKSPVPLVSTVTGTVSTSYQRGSVRLKGTMGNDTSIVPYGTISNVGDIRINRGATSKAINTTTKSERVEDHKYNGLGAEAVTIGLNSLTDAFIGGYQASLENQVTKGSYTNGSNMFANELYHFYGARCSVTGQQAERIDKYFDAFGYAMNDIYTPERRVRQKYTYIQTRNCLIDGDIPADDRAKIEKVYNEGVRFWVNGAVDMGVYDIAGNGIL